MIIFIDVDIVVNSLMILLLPLGYLASTVQMHLHKQHQSS